MKAIDSYFNGLAEIFERVCASQKEAIVAAAKATADALEAGGTVFTFGTGHSHMLALEIFYRAGGLAKVCPILDEPLMLHAGAARSSNMERLSGYAETLIGDIDGIRSGDVMFIFSNSGRNTVSIDMALEAKKKGMCVICITNLKHSASVTSRHPSGRLLFEVSDIVIDNCGTVGDASLNIGGTVCGPTSTAVGAAVMQAIVCGAVEELQNRGKRPEVFSSSNVDGGDAVNAEYIKKYKGSIRAL